MLRQLLIIAKIIIKIILKMYSELKGTWSSIEKDVDYKSVVWKTDKNGIPRFDFFDENYNAL
jgi:hypothetical protein